MSFIAYDDPLGGAARPRAALAGDRRPHARRTRRRGDVAGLARVADPPCHAGQVIDWNLAGTVARGIAGLQPAGDPEPFMAVEGPAAESEALVSAYTGLVAADADPGVRGASAPGLDRCQPELARDRAGARREAARQGPRPARRGRRRPAGDRGGRRLRLPRRPRARPVRVPGAGPGRARAAAVRRAEPRARGRLAGRRPRPAAALGRAARDHARAAVRRRPVAAAVPGGDDHRAARRAAGRPARAAAAAGRRRPAPAVRAGARGRPGDDRRRAPAPRGCSIACRRSWPCSRATPST